MVVGLPEQQPVEPGGRVVVRLPATGAALVAATAGAVQYAAAVAAMVTATVTAATGQRQYGAADQVAERTTAATANPFAGPVVVGTVVVVEIVVRRPAPRTDLQRMPVQPPIHHRVDGRMGVAQQQSDHGYQPVYSFTTRAAGGAVVVLRRETEPVRIKQRSRVWQPARDEHARQRHQHFCQPPPAPGARSRTRFLLLLLLLLRMQL